MSHVLYRVETYVQFGRVRYVILENAIVQLIGDSRVKFSYNEGGRKNVAYAFADIGSGCFLTRREAEEEIERLKKLHEDRQ